MAIPLVVSIVGETKKLEQGLDRAADEVTVFGKKFDAGAVFKVAAFAGVATIAVDGLLQLGRAAADDALEAEKLALAIDSAGAATGDWAAQVDQAIARGQDLAFTDTQIRDALTPLVGVLGDVGAATDALALAQDVARLKGVDLATAADAVAKAEDGSAGSLAKLLKISTEGKTATEILAEAQRLAAGQADLYGDSQAGAADRAGIKLAELGEKVGTLVLPLLDLLFAAVNFVIDALDWLADNVLPPVGKALDVVGDGWSRFLRGIEKVIGAIANLIDWIRKALDWLADLADALAEDLALFPTSAPGGGGLFQGPGLADLAGGPAVAGPSSSTTITINAGGQDPETIIRAIRRWAGVNGGAGAFTREIDGRG